MNIITAIVTRSFAPATAAVSPIWDGERFKKEIARLSKELEAHEIYRNDLTEFDRTIYRILERRETPAGEDANILLSFQLFLMTIDPTIKKQAEISTVLKASNKAGSLLYSMITGGFSRDQYPFVVCEHLMPYYTEEEIRATVNKIGQHGCVGVCVSVELMEFLALTTNWSIEQKNRFFTAVFSGLLGSKKEIFLAEMHQRLSSEKLTNCCAKGGDVLKAELQTFTKMCNNHLETIQKAIDHEDPVSIPSDIPEIRLYLLMRLRTIYKDNPDKFAFVASAMESEEWTWLKEQIFPRKHYAALYHHGESMPFYRGSADCFNKEVAAASLQVLSWISYVATTSQKKRLPANEYGYFYYLSTEFVKELNGWPLLSDSSLKPFVHQLPALILAANIDTFSNSFLGRLFPILIKEFPDKFHECCLTLIQQKQKVYIEKLFKILQEANLLDYGLQFFNSGKLTAASWIQLFCALSSKYQVILLKNFFTSTTTSKGAFAIRPSSVEVFCDYLVSSHTQLKEFSPDTVRLFTHSLRQKLNEVSPNLPKVVAQELKKRGVKELSALITELELDEKEASDPKLKQQRAIKQLTELLSTPPTTVTLNLAKESAKEVNLKTLGEIRTLFSSIQMQMWPLLFYVGKNSFNFASLYPKGFQDDEEGEWWKQTVGFSIKEVLVDDQQDLVKVRENLFHQLVATKSATQVLTHCVVTYSLPEFFALLAQLRAFQPAKLAENSLYHQARVLYFAHSANKVESLTSLLYAYWQNPLLGRNFDADCVAKELLSEPLCSPAEQQLVAVALTKQTNFFSFFYHATAIHENLFAALQQINPKGLPELIKSWINLVMASQERPLIKKQFILFFLDGAARVKLDPLNLVSAENLSPLIQLFREYPEPGNLHSTIYLQVIVLREGFCEFLLRTLTDFVQAEMLSSFSLSKLCENLALLNKKKLFLDFLAKNKDKQLLQQFINNRFEACCQSGPHLLSLVVAVIPEWKKSLTDLINKIRDDQEDDEATSNLANLQASLRAANLLADFESSFPETTESKEGKH